MNAFYLAFTVVFPLFALMGLGYFLRYVKIFDDEFLKKLNSLNFKVFLPMVLFMSIYNSNFDEDFSWKLIGSAYVFILLNFAALMFIIPKLEEDDPKRGVMIQGIFRSNFILFGLPVVETIYGTAALSVTAVLISFTVPVLNALSVIALETYGPERSGPMRILKSVMTHPLILASFAGIFVVKTGLRFPVVVEDVMTDVAGMATPLALVVLGGSFYFSSIHRFWKQLVLSVIGRLLVVPGIFVTAAILLGFRDVELISLFCMIGSPTAVSSYTMAQNMGGDSELAGQIVVMTSLCSLLTIFCWISGMTIFQLL